MPSPSVEPALPEARASRPLLTPPAGVDATAYWLGLAAALFLAFTIGIQLLLNILLLLGPVRPSPAQVANWTLRSQYVIRPEREMPIFIGGMILMPALMLALAALWLRRVRVAVPDDRRRFAWTSAIHQIVLAAGGLALYFTLLWNRFPLPPGAVRGDLRVASGRSATALLFLPAALSVACLLVDLWPRLSRQAIRSSRLLIAGRFVLELAVLALLVLSVFIPRTHWRLLAGRFLVAEGLHHWSYYAMAPALAFAHGKAFFTDFFSQYGFGWPMLYAAFHGRPLTYSGLVGMAIIYGCVYFVGVYLLARLLFRNVLWAGIAAVLALMLRLYAGMIVETQWRFPSVTVIRHPADVWFLLALVLYERRGGRGWLVLAGAMCGAGLCFGTDTGIYLLATLAIYGLFVALRSGIRNAGATLGVALAAAFAVLSAFAWSANRGRFPGLTFWSGWIESIRVYGIGGMGMLPMASVDDAGIALFVVVVIVYFIALTIKAVHVLNRQDSAHSTLLALVACYGMLQLLTFIGNSGTGALYVVSVPFAIVAVGLLHQWRETARERVPFTAIPAAMLIAAAAMLLTKQEFTVAPTLLCGRPRTAAISLTKDLQIPADTDKGTIDVLRQWMKTLPPTIRRFAADGSEVAVFDPWETVFYAAADVCPWPRYPDSITSMLTRDMIEQAQAELLRRHPRYVLLRDSSAYYPASEDVWSAYQQTLRSGTYERIKNVCGFGVWRYRQAASAPPAATMPTDAH